MKKKEGLAPSYLSHQQRNWSFKLDKVLHEASQEQVYNECASGLISHLLEGYNATLMAYGQTGAGKTYTMTGSFSHYEQRGIIPRTVAHLFREIKERHELKASIRVSYFEIYNDSPHDLLITLPDSSSTCSKRIAATSSASTLVVCEDKDGNVYVKGLTIRPAKTEEEVLNMLFEGETNRSIAEHSLNLHSSRSHCIFTLYVEARSHINSKYTISKLNLVDLAGSERLGKTNPRGNTQREAMAINKSLSFLEQVALALNEKSRDFIPYRQSKLTHFLKDSLGGNCCTLVLANIWVEAEQIEETISTLRFASRIIRVHNDPIRNMLHEPKRLIKEQEEEIKMLRMELAMHDTLLGKQSTSYEPLGEVQQQDIDSNIRLYIGGGLPDLEIRSVRQVKETFQRFKNLIVSAENFRTYSSSSFLEARFAPLSPTTNETESIKKISYTAKRLGKKPIVGSITPSDLEIGSSVYETKVGVNEGTGFAIGLASTDTKSIVSPVAAVRKVNNASTTPPQLKIKDEIGIKHEPMAKDELRVYSSSLKCSQSPPPREEEFGKFKKERGKKINEVFLSNKDQYLAKRKECLELSDAINKLKSEIDKKINYLDDRRRERETDYLPPLTSEAGETILEEYEFTALTQLKTLKTEFREKYRQLKEIQACVKVVKQYMDRSRTKLLSEFAEWYRVCYVGGDLSVGEEEPSMEIDQKAKSEPERFEKLQSALLKEDPSIIAFYNAQLRTERRAMSRRQARKPGEVMMSGRNRPPGVMTII